MARAPVLLTNVGSGYTILSEVTDPTAAGQNSTQTNRPLHKFLKGEPKALGTVQIMIGFLMILFGIVMAIFPRSLSVYTGVVFWGSLFVNATLVLNIINAIATGIAIVVFSFDFIFVIYVFNACYYDSSGYHCSGHDTEGFVLGINGVLLVFSLLQFCISISVSAFVCKATCTHEPTRGSGSAVNSLECCNYGNHVVYVVQNPETFAPSASVVSAFPPHHTQLGGNTMHAIAMGTLPVENPPVYSEKEV
ncbi:membrane-spanning 4-domains subfamily A member 4A-like isoform X2 [Hemibagrus wyckioides]|uniref:membrane-spanning 4-domains subfamily A member 4A-like isoform X2 n=1 Tax=Hemibagrus wyckioides TaxID=337641 RepID=UPI00266C4ED5|nr:membrane-spanning 4-domains subfamily A member 4A-like isoform X2 [Hemibagrus wyckioides]